jgi:hypothetical protein
MNENLQLMNEVSSFATACEVVRCLVVDKKMERLISIPEFPTFQDILTEIGPLPEEALFFGLADDGLPVLLNIWDPTPGPILVAGDSKVGKTDFLKTIARFIVSAHKPCEIQYGVITNCPCEWDGFIEFPHCVGVFSAMQKDAADFIRALAIWIEMNKAIDQSVLLLIDGLDDFVNLNDGLSQDLQKILVRGPAKKVWPIATLDLENFRTTNVWTSFFQTRIFGYTKHTCTIDDDGYHNTGFETLSKGFEFSLKEDSKWIKFRISRT